ncbi:MAG: aldo/keto reductase [Peptoniphilaceae bacterium]|jgi:predicted aldo/keto reductase-like oxidoreductase|nr:aldo/keto reductase [Bacillota bacterium]
MLYRNFTKDKLRVSQLGFGCMRLPVLAEDNSEIDISLATEMVRQAVNNGLNYIDTAWGYHEERSESFVKKALANDYRRKVFLADKLPVWLTDDYAAFSEYFHTQRERCGTKYFDFYLLHSLHKKSWDKVKALGVLEFLDEMKAAGYIKYAGFSFHDAIPVFKEIIDAYPWDFCQIQLNYMDTDYQAGLSGMRYAAQKGIDIVVMEPVKGGKLAFVPEEVRNELAKADPRVSPAAWALRYVWNQPEVKVVLSGMSTMDQVNENLQTASYARAHSLQKHELAAIEQARRIFTERTQIGCTSCEYCLPCPYGVNIPGVFERWNNAYVYNLADENRASYKKLIEAEKDASHCVACGRCEGLCPQHLSIIRDLKQAHAYLQEE